MDHKSINSQDRNLGVYSIHFEALWTRLTVKLRRPVAATVSSLPANGAHSEIVVQVGWFLHTPFPSSEIYRTLPVREEVLRAVLKADLIGFHTYDYARHFVSACTRILGLEVRTLLPKP